MTVVIHPRAVMAPEHLFTVSAPVTSISRGGPAQKVERRVMRVTAYTAKDKGMNGLRITANGEHVQEGRTVAADAGIPFGTQIYIPALGKTFVVADRGGAIKGDRLDLYMERREDAMKFGVRMLEVWIKE